MALGKKTLYIMVPTNVFLWGYISYAIYQYMNEEPPELTELKDISRLQLNEDTSTYTLRLDYPDPFLKEEATKKSIKHNSTSVISKTPVIAQSAKTRTISPDPPKDIRYLGLIQNKTNGTSTALVSINGKSYIIKKGEIVEGINFESISDQTIIAKIGKAKLTISKS